MSCPATTSPHAVTTPFNRLFVAFRQILKLAPTLKLVMGRRSVGNDGSRPARLDLNLLSDHDLRDLGLPAREPLRLERGLWLSAPWQPGSQGSRSGNLPPI